MARMTGQDARMSGAKLYRSHPTTMQDRRNAAATLRGAREAKKYGSGLHKNFLIGYRNAQKVAGGLGSGRNIGSFEHRSGQWKKGKGGRFVGSGG